MLFGVILGVFRRWGKEGTGERENGRKGERGNGGTERNGQQDMSAYFKKNQKTFATLKIRTYLCTTYRYYRHMVSLVVHRHKCVLCLNGSYHAITDLDKNAITVGCAGAYNPVHSFGTDRTSTHTPWMRLIFAYEDGIVHVYRDGEFVWNHTAFNTEDRRAQYCLKVGVPIYFGAGGYVGDKMDKSFDIATVAVWGKTLTEEEVRALGDVSQMPPADLE
jgi:hypothetical protein